MSDPEQTASLEEIRALVHELPGPDLASGSGTLEALARLASPAALGPLAGHAAWLARWQGHQPPRLLRPRVSIMVGTHGTAPSAAGEAIAARVQACVDGRAAVNRICRTVDADLRVYELALERPTAAIDREPAMDEDDCARAMAYGMMAIEAGIDVIGLAGLPSGGEASAAALLTALAGGRPADWLPPGDAAGPRAEAALALHRDALGEPFEALRRLGGYETAAIAGAVMAARLARTPVLLEGLAALAGAAVVRAAAAGSLDHCRVAGSPALAARLGLEVMAVPDAGDEPGLALGLAAAALKAAAELAQPD